MPIMWTSELSVNVKEIDEQHQAFLEILNNLYDVMIKNGPASEVANILRQLTAYASFHFATEEKYFDKFSYPLSAEHKEEHKKLLNSVAEFNRRFLAEKESILPELMNFIEDWLTEHLIVQDKKYSKFFNEHNLV